MVEKHPSSEAHAASEWFQCCSCRGLAGYFVSAYVKQGHMIPAGAVMHTKPSCLLYKQSSPAAFIALHRDAPRIDPPDDLRPILG